MPPTARPTRARRRLPVVALALVTAVILAGCAAGPPASRSADGEITIALGTSPTNLDFTRSAGVAIPQALLYNVYEGLVKIDDDARVVPLLAESWTAAPDGLGYTFRLREGVRFSDGTPMTADDVAFSFDRLDEWTTASARSLSSISGTRVLSPREVVVELSEPDNDLLRNLAGPAGAIFTPGAVDELATSAVGTGPYRVEDYAQSFEMRLVANDDHWAGPPPADRLTLAYYSDPTAQVNALLSGSADAVVGLTAPQLLEQLEGDPEFGVTEGTTNGEVVLAMNNATAPFDDERVRRAIRHAVDDDAVREVAADGRGTAITSMVPPTDPWYDDRPDPYPHDPERAAQLLAEAGLTGAEIGFTVPNLPQYVAAAQVVQSDLTRVGLTVDLRIREFPAVWLDEVFSRKDYQLAIINHAEPWDIGQFSNPDYYFGYQDPVADDMLEQARSGPAEEYPDRMRAYAERISDRAAAGFLYLTPWLTAHRSDVTGLPVNSTSESIDLTRVARG
ncbi:ABC transporter substrate-binding protein [Pseudonocardia kongjuensis]|uniref:ABC transporter substrate-binding protein n=1 Tax=Pseudonocardia kongjuensis TaxID=102227 RepID=A0ABP4ISZ1_9PSEU